jgi:hypothetical protein
MNTRLMKSVWADTGYGVLISTWGYWRWHNEQILDTIPKDRRLFVRTANLSSRLSDIASFLEVPVAHLRHAHSYRTSEKHGVLQRIDRNYVLEKIRDNCKRAVERLNREASVSIKPADDGTL